MQSTFKQQLFATGLSQRFQRDYSSTSFCIAAISMAFLTSFARAQTTVVNTLNDVTDFTGTQQIVDLPVPDGMISLREVLRAVDLNGNQRADARDMPMFITAMLGGCCAATGATYMK